MGAIVLFTWSAVGLHVISRDLVAAAPATPQGGLLYFVNTTSDTVVANACANGLAGCSLRGAIQVANSHVGADGIEIDLPAGSVINLTQALPILTEGVTIAGPGANLVTVRRNTGGDYRIFAVNVPAPGTVTFSGLTISNGFVSAQGGGIFNNGTMSVINCTLSGNTAMGAFGAGGGIFNNFGTVNVTNSTLSGNQADREGGGIYNGGIVHVTNSTLSGNTAMGTLGAGGGVYNIGTMNVINSTLSGNQSAQNGGGIYNASGTLNVTNSTLSGNQSAGQGGGIFIEAGVINITNSTISGNQSANSGGILNISTVNVRSSIIALNTGGSVPDVGGNFISAGFNLIGKRDGSTGFTAATDQTGTIAAPLNPGLDPAGLQNNGGPTRTIALQFASPAIDKGTSNGLTGSLTTDQRSSGFSRTFDDPGIGNAIGGDDTDIGAFEVQTRAPTNLVNISTRLNVQPGNNRLIGGFIVTGTAPKKVIVRALGPSLNVGGVTVPGRLGDTTLQLVGPGGVIATNDNWRTGGQEAQIIASTVPPPNDLESAIVATLPANTTAYSVIVEGVGNTSGVGSVEVYDLDQAADSQLANISTRGLVQTGDNVMIGGLIVVGPGSRRVIVRAIGPSLNVNGVPVAGRLPDTTLEIVNSNGMILSMNDDWRIGGQEAEIIATTVPPPNNLESAIVVTLSAAPYTAIVRGKNSTTGIALVEAFALTN